MSDIIERLHAEQKAVTAALGVRSFVIGEAADEIESLRKQLAASKKRANKMGRCKEQLEGYLVREEKLRGLVISLSIEKGKLEDQVAVLKKAFNIVTEGKKQ